MKPEDLDDFLVWAALGVVLGGRLGYMLFYDFARYLANPLDIFAVWQGGMSFHGGFLGTTLAMILFARSRGISDLDACSTSSRPACRWRSVWCASPISSIPNFGAGRPTFPGRSNSRMAARFTRHPSQLYEAALEGLVLFVLLRILTHSFLKLKTPGFVAGAFVAGYGAVAHLRRVLPRAGPAARLSVRRLADHGHGAVAADGAGSASGRWRGRAPAARHSPA